MSVLLVKIQKSAARLRQAELWLAGDPSGPDIPVCGAQVELLGKLYRDAGTPGRNAEALALLRKAALQHVALMLQCRDLENERAEATAHVERYLDLFDFAPLPYITIGLSGVILEANRASGELFEENAGALKGRPLSDLFEAMQGAALVEWILKTTSAKFSETYRLEYQHLNRNRKVFQVAARLSATGTAILMILDDVTRVAV